MSSYLRMTKNPITNEFEPAAWIDDYYGHHEYGVRFLSDIDETYPEKGREWETSDTPITESWDEFYPPVSFTEDEE